MISNPTPRSAPSERQPSRSDSLYVTGFHAIPPRFRSSQEALLAWLSSAHLRSGTVDPQTLKALFSRYGASLDHIAFRGHELADFTHDQWEDMRLFGPRGSDIAQKTKFFSETASSIFERLYSEGSEAPEAIIHVTCTGYSSPSGAQRLVSARDWGQRTQVFHAYHMGCYAAHPALQIASGLLTSAGRTQRAIDIVHTELCSLHLDPAKHDPAQLVIQSLFADGFIKYQVAPLGDEKASRLAGLEILALRDEIVPDSIEAMHWTTGPLFFTMGLSKEVPTLFASALPRFVDRLFQDAGFNAAAEKPSAIFAIHPGGPRIIELAQKILGLESAQVAWSRQILREHGNMSSATLPHVWQRLLEDPAIPYGTLIASLGAGPGLTLSGALFRKRSPQ